jgi:hypothetical protein
MKEADNEAASPPVALCLECHLAPLCSNLVPSPRGLNVKAAGAISFFFGLFGLFPVLLSFRLHAVYNDTSPCAFQVPRLF